MSFGQKKRHASEALEEMLGVDSPASKRSRVETGTPSPLGLDDDEHEARNGDRREEEEGADKAGERGGAERPMERLSISEERDGRTNDGGGDDDDDDDDNDNDDDDDDMRGAAPIRQSAPTAGYDDLYLDTIDRNVLDFDFEKLCSVSLSNINVYACLVCGRYYQGRGPKSHAYFHALDENHHVFINMQTQKVYVLPEGYEVLSSSLDDIKKDYLKRRRPRALAHVPPLRNYLLLEDLGQAATTTTKAGGGSSGSSGSSNNQTAELVRRCSTLLRKMWNPRAFKAHVSPHELLQAVSLLSNKRFTLTTQSDPVDFLSWFLNNLHLGLGGSRTRPGSSMVQRVFQGKVKVESQAITAKADAFDRLRFEDAEVKVDISRFLLLTLDLPPTPLFQDDDEERSIIPQVPLTSILAKYDGVSAQEHLNHRRRYRLMHPLPPYLILHVKRFSRNKFVSERNPTIVTFDPQGLDMSPYVEPDPALYPPGEPVLYDLVANVVHEAVKAKDDVADSSEERKTWKVQLRDRARDEWVVCQDLFVDKIRNELLYLGETYLQVWERRRDPKRKGRAA
ncbi:U4/U6.U5 tri-snRNP-associated protein 2 [Magnaporthiopsis poae ATCC 64411]|uniref:U4/U6.U5 tri-snRNP-associated protein 2 n=1 Tax=Magnaporthiopsis poae (strain ATCC 64411 / 73-15) TaxID=644358 RepID=A0A0C4E4I2_MAGP6|nr:U4/U6.U5 tri-snRNP-associated protein 2 [Magnaporthiopsis poae ATCC 64411]